MRIAELLEARKNPELNKHVGITKAMLDYYEKNPNGFVSFTRREKLGINPKTPFNTPLGIYAYQLSYVIDNIENSSTSNLPFAGSEPYANFFNIKGDILDNDLTTREEDMIIWHLRGIYPNTQDVIYDMRSSMKTKSTPFSRIWYLTYKLSMVDKGRSLNPQQYLSFLGINLKTPSVAKYLRNEQLTRVEYDDILKIITRALDNDNGVDEYQVMSKLDSKLSFNDRITAILNDAAPHTTKRRASIYNWNKLMRELGYDAAVDNGEGVIHSNEPYQAVVFNPRAIVNVHRVLNSRDVETVSSMQERGEMLKQMSNAYKRGDFDTLNALFHKYPQATSMFYKRMPEGFLDKIAKPQGADKE